MPESPRRSSRLCKKPAMSETSEKEKGKSKGASKDQGQVQVKFSEEFGNFKKDIATMIAQQETRISLKFKQLEDKFTDMFKEMRSDINQVRVDVEETNRKVTDISEKVTELEKSVQHHSIQVDDNENKCKGRYSDIETKLDTKTDELDKKLKLLEKHDRKYNLLFYGFPEETNENVYTTMRDSFVQDLKIDEERVHNMYFSNGHRLPSKNPGPKPIILRFTSFEDRELVLSSSYQYGGMKKRALVDLPEDMKKERNRLAKKAFEIRHSEDLKTRIRDKGLSMVLEVRPKNPGPTEKWVQRVV